MVVEGDTLIHYGTPRHSGRYPWGSGKDKEHSLDLIDRIDNLKEKGFNQVEIAKALGYSSTTQLRKARSIANDDRKQLFMRQVQTLRDQGLSNTEIARKLDKPESTIRYSVSNAERIEKTQLKNTSSMLKDAMQDKPYLDVGPGVELQLGISRQKLRTAVQQLKDQGYFEHKIYIPRLNDPNKYTTVDVVTKEKDIRVVQKHKADISAPNQKSNDGGMTYEGLKPPKNIPWDKVGIKYGDQGGEDRDGLIQVRPGVKDLDLGSAKYAQVRIAVGGTHYLKGMAMYSDDLPAGKDLVFNTNKPKGTPKEQVLKPLKDNPANPFGTRIIDQRGAFNIVNEEGSWDDWNGSKFSAQFLSKQPLSLVNDRIKATYSKQKETFDELNSLTNPIVKKMLLSKFAETVDKQEKELKLMGLPRTKAHVLLPFPDMKPNEVYAPNYNNGERVVLIRYPHAGTFEIPELTVNNRAPSPKKALGSAMDAIGIHPSVAHKLSGADFDGDAVYVIPNNKKQIKSSPSLKGLKDFDPNIYQVPDGHKTIDKKTKQHQMGNVSNLIADMTIKGASVSELTRAVRHSMVVIDSMKHNLDWKQSAKDNGIAALRKKYEVRESLTYDPVTKTISKGRKSIGGSTLITRADSKVTVGKKVVNYIDKKTGKHVSTTIPVKENTLDLISDASLLSSGNPKENAYANYINSLKALSSKANDAANHIYVKPRNKEAAKLYTNEVTSLDNKLKTALSNAPSERAAQILANEIVHKNYSDGMTREEVNKLKRQAMEDARIIKGAKSRKDREITITDKEWEAIQAGAISPSKLGQILNNADLDTVKKLATPKQSAKLPAARLSRAKTLLDRGYTYADVANVMGVSVSTLKRNMEGV